MCVLCVGGGENGDDGTDGKHRSIPSSFCASLWTDEYATGFYVGMDLSSEEERAKIEVRAALCYRL